MWVANGLIPALKVIFCSSAPRSVGLDGVFSLSVSLIPALSDFTGVNGDCILALLTANGAAPGKLAGASLHHLGPARSVSRPAAHQLASVWRQSRGSCFTKDRFVVDLRVGFSFFPFEVDLTVASPACGPRDTVLGIEMAEIWGGRKVEEISGSRGFHLGVPREQSCSRCYTGQTDLRGRKRMLTGLDAAGKKDLKGFSEGCVSKAPLWHRRSVPSARCQRA